MTIDLNYRYWFSTKQAVEYTGRSKDYILEALATGDLKGHQRVVGGRWSIHRDDLDAWMRGEK